MKVRLAGLLPSSLVNGPGIRMVIFAQGCIHNCEGCFNQHTHSFDGGEEINCEEIINKIKKDPFLKGVTFSGGDPFEQPNQFKWLADEIHKLGLNIWSYTGYTFEELLKDSEKYELLKSIDILVDGKFVISLKSDKCKFRGSTNQRIIDIQKSLKQNKVIEVEEYKWQNMQ